MNNNKRKLRRIENVILCLLAFSLIFVPAVWFSSGTLRIAMAVLAIGTLLTGGIIAYRREKRDGVSVDQGDYRAP